MASTPPRTTGTPDFEAWRAWVEGRIREQGDELGGQRIRIKAAQQQQQTISNGQGDSNRIINVVQDGQEVPLAPTIDNVSAAITYDAFGYPQAQLSVTATTVEESTNSKPIEVAFYELYGKDAGSDDSFALLCSSTDLTANDGFVTFDGISVPVGGGWILAARAVSRQGVPSAYSDSVPYAAPVDTTPPPVPTAPSASSRMGLVDLFWDGGFSGGAARPADFDHINIRQYAAASGGAGTLVGQLRAGGAFPVSDLPYNETFYFTFSAVDFSGNESAETVRTPCEVVPLVDTDIIGKIIDGANVKLESITGDLIAAGAIDEVALEQSVKDDIAQAIQDAADAKDDAAQAQTSADGKNTIYRQPTAPPGTNHKQGDTWFNVAEGNKIYTWNSVTQQWTDAQDHEIGQALDLAKFASLAAPELIANPTFDPDGPPYPLGWGIWAGHTSGRYYPGFGLLIGIGDDLATPVAERVGQQTFLSSGRADYYIVPPGVTIRATASVFAKEGSFPLDLVLYNPAFGPSSGVTTPLTGAGSFSVDWTNDTGSQAYAMVRIVSGMTNGVDDLAAISSVSAQDITDLQGVLETANSKNKNYYQGTEPTGGDYGIGDTWFDTSNGNRIYTWDGGSWEPVLLDEGALAESVTDSIGQAQSNANQAMQDATDALTKAGAAVKSVSTQYATSATPSAPPSSGWSTATPTHSPGVYIWMRQVTTYGDDSTSTSSPTLVTGNTGPKGEKGDDGAGIEISGTVANYASLPSGLGPGDAGRAYLVSSDGKLYIWDGSAWPANGAGVEFRGPKGDDGSPGTPGAPGSPGSDGVSVSSVTPYYLLKGAGTGAPAKPTTNPPGGGWTLTEPGYQSSMELYRTELIVLSDSSFGYSAVSKVSAYTGSTQAITAANLAQASADGKVKASQTDPGHDVGRIWLVLNGSGQTIGIRISNGSAWSSYAIVADQVLVPSSVGSTVIANGAITTPKIVTGAITAASGIIADAAIETAKIIDGAITNAKISNLDAGKITTGFLDALRIEARSLSADKLAVGTITAASGVIANAAIGTAQIADLAVTGAKIQDATITNAKIANLDAGKITTGTLDADRIGARSITAGKLLITNLNNLVENGSFEVASSGGEIGAAAWVSRHAQATRVAENPRTGTYSLKLNTTTAGYIAIRTATMFAVTAGEKYRVGGWVRKASGTSVGAGVALRFTHGATDGSRTSSPDSAVTPVGTGTNYVYITGVWEAPSTAKFAALDIVMRDTTSGQAYHVDDIEIFKMSSGELIVDGAITADKIAAGAITTAKLEAGAVTAAKIAANTITANEIAALTITGDEIAANTITGAKIQALSIESGNIAANAITADKIQAGAITAIKVAARSITADKLVVGDNTNYFQDPTFELDYTPWTRPTGTAYIQKMGTGALHGAIYESTQFPVEPGDKIIATGRGSIYAGSGNWGIDVRIIWRQINGTVIGIQQTLWTATNATGSSGTSTVRTAPANAAYGVLAIYSTAATSSSTGVRLLDLNVRKQVDAHLIVNGAITGEKISADAIDGKTITGALIRSAASGARTEMTNQGLRTLNSAGQELVKVGYGITTGMEVRNPYTNTLVPLANAAFGAASISATASLSYGLSPNTSTSYTRHSADTLTLTFTAPSTAGTLSWGQVWLFNSGSFGTQSPVVYVQPVINGSPLTTSVGSGGSNFPVYATAAPRGFNLSALEDWSCNANTSISIATTPGASFTVQLQFRYITGAMSATTCYLVNRFISFTPSFQ